MLREFMKNCIDTRVSRVRIFQVDLDYFLASFRDKVEIERGRRRASFEIFWFLLQDLDTQSLKLVHHCEITTVQLEPGYFLTSIREIFPFIYSMY